MTIKTRLLTSAAVVAALPFTAMPAFAQEGAVDLGSITLGSLRDLATDTAVPKTTLDQEELDVRNPSSLAEALGTIPGVTLVNAATPQGSAINIRGFGADAGVYGGNTKVNVVVDGVAKGQEEIYRQGSLLNMDPELVKSATVLRGPSGGFAFAPGAFGGTVQVETKDAADFLQDGKTMAVRAKLGYGSNGSEKSGSLILAWMPSSKMDVILSYTKRQRDDYTAADGTVVADTKFDNYGVLAKVKFHINDDTNVVVGLTRNVNQLKDVSYDLFGSLFGARIDADIQDSGAYVKFNYNPAGNDMVNMTVRLNYSDELIENVSATTSSTIYNADNRTKRVSFQVENQAKFQTGAVSHTLLTGLEVGKRDRGSLSHTGASASATPEGTDEFIAVYAIDEMKVGNWTITPSVRFDRQVITGGNNSGTSFFTRIPYTFVSNGVEYKASDWTGGLTARYQVNDAFAVFAGFAYNANQPIIDDLPSSSAPSATHKIFTTETARTFEGGLSYSKGSTFAADDRLSAKLTGFKTQVFNDTTYSSNTQEGFTVTGYEFELSYVNPQFYLDLNASSVRADWDDGRIFSDAPADSAQLTLGKRFMDDQLDVSVEVVHWWANNRTTSSGTTGATSPSPNITVLNLASSYKPKSGAMKGWEFRFGVNNVGDKFYKPYLTSKPMPGRTAKFSIAKTF